jgi:hypothetical protein
MLELFKVRLLTAADAEAYCEVRLLALHEHPPAFGSIPADEPSLDETAVRLVASDDRFCACINHWASKFTAQSKRLFREQGISMMSIY